MVGNCSSPVRLTGRFLEKTRVDNIRFCLVGAGRAGLIHARNIARRIPNAELVAVCDSNPDSVAEVGDELAVSVRLTDYREAVTRSDVDAVVIVTPTFLHRDIACLAADSGKHVFLEKPMAVTVEECEAVMAAVEQAGVKLQIGFMRRFDEGFCRAKAILDSGEMGRVMKIKSTGRGPGLPSPWMFDLAKSNGIVAEVNSHDMDSLRWFTGSDVVRAYAEAANFKCEAARTDFPDFYDNILVMFRFEDGTIGEVDGTCPCHYGYDARVEILCEKGVLFVGSVTQQGVTHVTVDGQVANRAVESWRYLFKDAYLAEMEHFIACVCEDRAPSVTGRDGLKAVEMVLAANRSLREGGKVELNEGTAK